MRPTIMDFGIARSSGRDGQGVATGAKSGPGMWVAAGLLAGQTMAGAVVGTIEYMAPEQAKGQPADQRADIYAFGLILYDMLIGRRRSEARGKRHCGAAGADAGGAAGSSHGRSHDPGGRRRDLTRCLEPDAGKRFQTTIELQSALDRLDDNGKPLPIIRRVTRRTIAASAMLVSLLLGGTFYVTKRLSAAPVEHDPITVVIADFQNNDERSDVRQHGRTDDETRAGRCELHHRDRPQPDSVHVWRAAAREVRRGGGARACRQTGSQRRPRRVGRPSRQRLRDFGRGNAAADRRT